MKPYKMYRDNKIVKTLLPLISYCKECKKGITQPKWDKLIEYCPECNSQLISENIWYEQFLLNYSTLS